MSNVRIAGIRIVTCVVVAGVVCAAGCASQPVSPGPARMVCQEGVTTAAVLQAAERVLVRMDFAIEKLDVEQGILRTRPLRAAQFFEPWRSDNVGPFNTAEANIQTIRRWVEVRVEAGDSRESVLAPRDESCGDARPTLSIQCDVSVQRLSLPENEIPSISQAYRMHSRSTPTLQRLAVTPLQQQDMAWLDLGRDPDLAARILQRIEQRLERRD